MLLSELRSATRSLVDETTEIPSLTNTEVDRFLNMRYQRANNAIVSKNEDYFGAIDTTIDLVSGTSSYALPDLDSNSKTRVLRIKRTEIAYDGTNFYRALPIDPTRIPSTVNINNAYSTTTPRYYLFGTTLYLIPSPTANATNAVKIWYIQMQSNMSSDSDLPAFPTSFHWFLPYGAAADILRKQDPVTFGAAADRFESSYQSGLQEMLEYISPRDMDTITVVRDVEDEDYYLTPEERVDPGSLTL